MDSKKLEEITARLREMRLPVMANQIVTMYESSELTDVVNVLDVITREELISRKNNTADRYRKSAHLSQGYAELSEIEYSPERKINERVIEQLSTGTYINKARNVVIVGACGTGKTYIANALASDACRKLHKTMYCRMFELISDIKHMEMTRLKRRYISPDVLVIDDFANTRMSEDDALQIFKIMEYRYGFRARLLLRNWNRKNGTKI